MVSENSGRDFAAGETFPKGDFVTVFSGEAGYNRDRAKEECI